MRIVVSSPGADIDEAEKDRIAKDLEKIDRRLHEFDDVLAEVRIDETHNAVGRHVVLEVHYRRNHLMAKAEHQDVGQAVREAREDILRQINDRSRGGHSSFAKRR